MIITATHNFDDLYLSNYAALCYFSLKIVGDKNIAEDIVEEVFVNLLNSKKEFTEGDNLKAWLYTATRNASLNHLRQDKRSKERQFQFTASQPAEESAYIYEMIRSETLNLILLEIKKLPGHSGKIIELSYLKDMKNDEIAELMGLSVKTVKNLKSMGMATLKTHLSPDAYLLLLLLSSLAVDPHLLQNITPY
ncbi:RNA polymerase sigma-70 factor [Pedobacter nyackensis]|uniref:RNA polymerase sigma factor n=1 Tax=Pedobacter nyackensis TaxID=475255 RepID=UPI00292F0CF9|nr:RNA polymerase sigma-70 factor [Pedobacter nyackensis]